MRQEVNLVIFNSKDGTGENGALGISGFPAESGWDGIRTERVHLGGGRDLGRDLGRRLSFVGHDRNRPVRVRCVHRRVAAGVGLRSPLQPAR